MRSSSGVKDVDDFELLRAWQAGDRRAGSELVQRNFQVLFRFFRNKIDDNPTDLIQQTLTTCVEVRDRVPDGVSFRAYALGIARNKLLHHLRRAQRQANAMRLQANAPVSVGDSPSQILAARQEQRLLLAALRKLPLDAQIAIELFYWEGLKIDESIVGDLEVEMTVNPLPKQFKMSSSKTQTSNRTPSPEPGAAEDSRAGKKGGLAGTDSLAHMDGRDSLALN